MESERMSVSQYNYIKESKEKALSRFIAEYPTDQLLDTICFTNPSRRIFFSKPSPPSSSSSGSSCLSVDTAADDDETADPWPRATMRMRRRVHEKIKRAFSTLYVPFLSGVIQFWAPPVFDAPTPAPTLLSTSRQPFVLSPSLSFPVQYRLFSINSPLLYGDAGPLASAYHTGFPDVVLSLQDHKGQSGPLVDKAVKCCLTCLILLPVFYRSRSNSYPETFSPCVGVVECCVNPSRLPKLFQALIEALNCRGFTTYRVQHHLPNLPTHGLNRAKDEIEDGLKIVCESLCLDLAQVWIDDDVVYHVPSSPSSLEEEEEGAGSHHQTDKPGKFFVKLCGFQTNPEKCDEASSDYYKVCDVLPLKFGDGLAGKTLQTHEPCFCKDLSTFQDHTGFSGLLCSKTKCSGLAICLRSTHTGKSVDYAFEFLWSEKRNPTVVLESLFLTLKTCLPSFTLASGAPLGEELRVIDVSISTAAVCETLSFKILQGNRFSPPKQEGTQVEKCYKRKLSHFFRGNAQPDTDSDSDSDDHVYYWMLSVVFRGKVHTFFCHSSKVADAKEKIEKFLPLDPGTYTLEFYHAGEKVVLNTDEDLARCVRNWRASLKRTYYDYDAFRFLLLVRPSTPLPSCPEKTQEIPATLG